MAFYPTELFSSFGKRPDFFKCRKAGKEILLFGTIHALPLSVLPPNYVEIMKTASTLFLEVNEDRLNNATAKEMEDYLMTIGLISATPQEQGFDAGLDLKTKKILENVLKILETETKTHIKLPFNRIKLDRAFWFCYFVSQLGGMETSLEELFSKDRIFGLESESTRPPLPTMEINEVNELIIRDYGCFNEPPEFSSGFLEDKRDVLSGFAFATNFYSSNHGEVDDPLVGGRTKAWMTVISEHMNNAYRGPVLIAVGRDHLVGGQGLLCYLQKDGYDIFQYKPFAKQESIGFEVFDPIKLFAVHQERFNIMPVVNEINKQLKNVLGTESGSAINCLVQEYYHQWPALIWSEIYPDKKSAAEADQSKLTSLASMSAATLAITTSGSASAAISIDGTKTPTQWEIELEKSRGEEALVWVGKQNLRTTSAFENSTDFLARKAAVLEILNDKRKIPYASINGKHLYNFWKDDKYKLGVWRRTTLEEYMKAEPKWEILLNLDNFPEEDKWNALVDPNLHKAKNIKEKWVYKGSHYLKPECKRVLIELSLGGSDATIFREFDLVAKAFVPNGFEIPEAISNVKWRDINSLWVGTKFEATSVTKSGWQKDIRFWERGMSFEQAKQHAKIIYSGKAEDFCVQVVVNVRSEGSYSCIVRLIEMTRRESFIINSNLSITQIPVPDFAVLEGFFKGQAIFSLRSDWQVPNGPKYKSGSLFSLRLDIVLDPTALKTTLIFEPTATCMFCSVTPYKDHMVVELLNNVVSELYSYEYLEDRWIGLPLPIPAGGRASLSPMNHLSNDFTFNYESYLQSPIFCLYHYETNRIIPLKYAPMMFDASKVEVNRYAIKSEQDNVEIPYTIIHSKLKYDSSSPTILYGYGAFQHSLTPFYLGGTIGKGWIERGGSFVVANLRGGGEFGPDWHKAGIKENRERSIEDFCTIAKDLMARKVTSPKHLGIYGESAGGILVGAAFLRQPGLFNAVCASSPVLDLMNFHKMGAGHKSICEYGNPDLPEDRKWLVNISPLDLLKKAKFDKEKQEYPAVLMTTSTSDDRVIPGHARKMADTMEKLGHKKYYYFEQVDGGHLGGGTNEQQAYKLALIFSFFERELNFSAKLSAVEENAKRAREPVIDTAMHAAAVRTNANPIAEQSTTSKEHTLKK